MPLLPVLSFNMDILEHQTLNTGRIVKAPVNRGFSKILDLFYTKAAAAGSDVLTTIVVPVGYFWVVEALSFINVNRATIAYVYVRNPAGANRVCLIHTTTVINTWTCHQNQLTISEDENLQVTFVTTVLNDDIRFAVYGRQVKIT